MQLSQVMIDFLKSETLKFFYPHYCLYKQEPVVLGYLLGVVCTIAFLSRHNLDQLEDFKLAELAMLAVDSLKAYVKTGMTNKGIIAIVLEHIDTAHPELLAVLMEIAKNMTTDEVYARMKEDAGVVERCGEEEAVMSGVTAKVGEEVVKVPSTLVVWVYAGCPATSLTVTSTTWWCSWTSLQVGR